MVAEIVGKVIPRVFFRMAPVRQRVKPPGGVRSVRFFVEVDIAMSAASLTTPRAVPTGFKTDRGTLSNRAAQDVEGKTGLSLLRHPDRIREVPIVFVHCNKGCWDGDRPKGPGYGCRKNAC